MLFVFHASAHTQIYPFPYTTLFRSAWNWHFAARRSAVLLLHELPRDQSELQLSDLRSGTHANRRGLRIDRKSTRLNSSHTVISYAVFCLKKKNSMKIDECVDKVTSL